MRERPSYEVFRYADYQRTPNERTMVSGKLALTRAIDYARRLTKWQTVTRVEVYQRGGVRDGSLVHVLVRREKGWSESAT